MRKQHVALASHGQPDGAKVAMARLELQGQADTYLRSRQFSDTGERHDLSLQYVQHVRSLELSYLCVHFRRVHVIQTLAVRYRQMPCPWGLNLLC
jgi:CO/xanthine dehydrogenase FAD-binding subunit